MRPIVAKVGPLQAASANNIALSQTPAAAGALVLNGALVVGGIAYLDTARRVLITTLDTTHIFTVTGTTPTGSIISEPVGPIGAGSLATQQDFATVTSVTINGAATAAVTVGTNGVASSPWVRLDEWASGAVSVQTTVTGVVNYTIQVSSDDPNSPTDPVAPYSMNWANSSDTDAVGASTSIVSSFWGVGSGNGFATPLWVRCLLNSGAGSVKMTVVQQESVSY